MKVVANAGPLMALGKLGLLHLLHQLYWAVSIPSAVHEEVVTRGLEMEQSDAYVCQLAMARGELVVVGVDDVSLSEAVRVLPLGKGEKQAIQLGLARSADWVLLDDSLAREETRRLGLKAKGTLGVIAEACRKGLISLSEAELISQAIITREDIWISEALIHRVWDDLREDVREG
jgi:predicted nucleic acid-binding protein